MVQEARRAEREAIRKRKAEARLAERVSMAISNVQKHGIEERLEEVKHEELSNAIRLVDNIRREEFDREEKIHLDRERASKERAAERRRLKEELERDVSSSATAKWIGCWRCGRRRLLSRSIRASSTPPYHRKRMRVNRGESRLRC